MNPTKLSAARPSPAGLAPRWRFLLLAGGLYVLWLVVYEGYVKTQTGLDAGLQQNLARASAALLRLLGFAAAAAPGEPLVNMDGQPAVLIGSACDGMAIYALFAGFVIAFPGPWRPKLWFVPLGVVGLYLLNIARIAALAINQHYAHHSVEFNHHYTFTVVVYSVIGLLWVWWSRHYGPAETTVAA